MSATFIDRCVRGLVPNPDEAIDDEVSVWHEGGSGLTLHDYLGMKWYEYAAWVRSPPMLQTIIQQRRNRMCVSVSDETLQRLQGCVPVEEEDTK